eukprot:m.337592 g.337592  ORF g.337592 m.337592 type:complete len:170 (-) comp18168_c0_seq1:179-688(-)
MPYLKFKTTGGEEVEVGGNKLEQFATAFEKAGNIMVPNYALAYVKSFFERRDAHIKMQKAKQLGDESGAQAAAKILDAADEKEEDAKEAYEKAIESGGPDLEVDVVEKVTETVAAVKIEPEVEEKPALTKIQIKKMKPAELKEALKEAGLSIQGSKGDLLARLLEANGF